MLGLGALASFCLVTAGCLANQKAKQNQVNLDGAHQTTTVVSTARNAPTLHSHRPLCRYQILAGKFDSNKHIPTTDIDNDSLLTGPLVQILHDERRDGSFILLAVDKPLPMLTYFSSTIRQQFPNESYHNHQHWPHSYPQPGPHRTSQTAVRLVGGDARAITDLLEWMAECCRKDALFSLQLSITCPVRYILALDVIQKLEIEILSWELPQTLARLRYELFDVRTVGRIFSARAAVLPEVAEAICHCVARYFFHGSLPEVDRWMSLARLNVNFDQGVAGWLSRGLHEGPDTLGAGALWERKDPGSYRARWHQSSWTDHTPVALYAPPSADWTRAATYHSSNMPPCVPDPRGGRIDIMLSHDYSVPVPAPPLTQLHPGPLPPPPKPEAYYHPPAPFYDPYGVPSEAYEPMRPYRPSVPTPHYPRAPSPPLEAYETIRSYHLPIYGEDYPGPVLPDPEYTIRCTHCQRIHSYSTGISQCYATGGHAYTISDASSPPVIYNQPRRRSVSTHRGRSRSQSDHRRSASDQRRWDPADPAYEPPRPGEYLRERRQIGTEHFLHFFVDDFGRERVVNKGDCMLGSGVPQDGRVW